MSPARLLVAALVLAAAGPASAALPDEAAFGPPIRIAALPNLAVYPLVAKAPEPDPGYATLDAAFESKVLRVHETSDSGQVSELHVDNDGDRPVYALAGEVLLGGKQDRIVGRNTLIPAQAKGFAIGVFCVEHGRWAGGETRFGTAKTLAHTRLRQTAAQAGDQSMVWAEVAANNALRATTNSTGTYRAAIRKGDFQRELETAAEALLRATGEVPEMAGVIVAINGEVRAVDWFAAPLLYRRLEAKLLRSYIAEALDAGDGKAYPAPGPVEISAFVVQGEAAPKAGEAESGDGRVQMYDAAAVEGSAVFDKKAPRAKAVHKTYYSKKGRAQPTQTNRAPMQQQIRGLGLGNNNAEVQQMNAAE